MLMRTLFKPAAALSFSLAATAVFAFSLSELSNQDAGSGLKAALEKGSIAAVGKLGVENGFLNNDKVKIGLPGILEQARPLLQMTGYGRKLDELVITMNRAAESAVPQALAAQCGEVDVGHRCKENPDRRRNFGDRFLQGKNCRTAQREVFAGR